MSPSTPPPPDGDDQAAQPPTNPYASPPAGGPPPPPPRSGYAGQPPGGYSPAEPPSAGYGAPGYGTPGYGPQGYAGEPAPLMPRLLARLIDFILLAVVIAVVQAVVVRGVLGLRGASYGVDVGASYAASSVSGVLGALIYLAYFALMESRTGQTLGKRLLRLRTQGPDGGPPSLEAAVRRNFWVALGVFAIVPFVGGAISGLVELVIVIVIMVGISQSSTRQAWHDRLAGGTQVVRV